MNPNEDDESKCPYCDEFVVEVNNHIKEVHIGGLVRIVHDNDEDEEEIEISFLSDNDEEISFV